MAVGDPHPTRQISGEVRAGVRRLTDEALVELLIEELRYRTAHLSHEGLNQTELALISAHDALREEYER